MKSAIRPLNGHQKKLVALAKKISRKAYSPYSKAKVGAAVLDSRGKIHVGCNVENATYGATVCAERNAIGAMIAAGSVQAVEVAVHTPDGWLPCGLCRQVIAEFAKDPKKLIIHVTSKKGVVGRYTLEQLLPSAFNKKDLVK